MTLNSWMYWVYLLHIVNIIRGHENLSRRNATSVSQSSDYRNQTAKYGIDGITTQTEYFCAHTAVNQSEAWFQVDLGEPFSLKTIRIVYRDEGYWRPYRFRYFYLDLSNSSVNGSTTTDRKRCYQDNTTVPDLPPSIINITCPFVARYVIVQNDYFGNDTHSTGPILEICEIEIFGCSINCNGECETTGYCAECNTNLWGENCIQSCPDHCNGGICNRTTGSCDFGCRNGTWGIFCNLTCSTNCADDVCEIKNGSCVNGCKGNFDGEKCEVCDAFHYGENCKESCGQGCINNTCFANNGTCSLGCVENFVYPKCNSEYHLMTKSHEETNKAPYIGVGIGVFLLLIFVLIGAIAVHRVFLKEKHLAAELVDCKRINPKIDINQPFLMTILESNYL
ncbi:uncharacterized protein LOC134275285 [Saccostrea cucullata]|uniref:uncharacterized protein LOC134275285 n=1 Tax=Saccostrea cuccullata TaxID=36930 RepID=UPI002ED35E2A